MEPQASPQPQPQDLARTIFLNERGLRAGWRLAIFIMLLAGILPVTFLTISRLVRNASSPGISPVNVLISEAGAFFAVALASWIMSRIEHRGMGDYGLPLRSGSALVRFAAGYILWGFLPLSLVLLAMRGLGAFYFGEQVLHGVEAFHFASLWGLAFLFVGLFEEYLMRGYALCTLAEGIGYWPAAIILAAVFALGHAGNGGESRLGVVMTGIFAIFLSITLRRTGTLWLAVGAHAGWDWGQSYFYGVADSGAQVNGHLLNPRIGEPEWLSGGSVGPEGSVLVLVLLVMMSVLFVALYRDPEARTGESSMVQA
jgi:membrane protease YdiL (CAAX protease family)